MRDHNFPTDIASIKARLQKVDPERYARTRNYLDGAVTMLSPYISRGVLSTRQVLDHIKSTGAGWNLVEPLVKELAWRDYFQRVWQTRDIKQDIRHPQPNVQYHGVASALVECRTNIQVVDHAIRELYQTGYMHNHARMYTASIACNIGKAHWLQPAKWMYHHLLDGDWASNACSWQWVAGAFSSKQYYANQENINKYTGTDQHTTFLDHSYESLPLMEVPAALKTTIPFAEETILPAEQPVQINKDQPTLVYNYYNLDPHWHRDEPANRILLLEPDHFREYPVSSKCIRFMLQLAENIPGIEVFTGSFAALQSMCGERDIIYKEHPLNRHYSGTEEPRDWLCTEVDGFFPSFFAYWKRIEPFVKNYYHAS